MPSYQSAYSLRIVIKTVIFESKAATIIDKRNYAVILFVCFLVYLHIIQYTMG